MVAQSRPFQISLGTLLILLSIGPPIIAFVWLAWRLILFLGLLLSLFIAVVALWVTVSLALARFFAGVICSVMR